MNVQRSSRLRSGRSLGLAVALFALLLAASAEDAKPSGPTRGWVHEAWTVEDGLPTNTLTQVVQTRDGFLWISSYNGLVRFDGVSFSTFRTSEVPELGSNRVIALEETADGLWIMSESGTLARYHQRRFEAITPPRAEDGRFVLLEKQRDGRLWVGADHAVFQLGPSGLEDPGIRFADRHLRDIEQDGEGRLWLGTTSGLGQFQSGRFTWHDTEHPVRGIVSLGDSVLAFVRRQEPLVLRDERSERWQGGEEVPPLRGGARVEPIPWGGTLAVNGRHFLRFDGTRLELLATSPELVKARGITAVDGQGHRWLAAGPQLYRDSVPVFRLPDNAMIHSLAIDREGTLWLATSRHGLHAVRRARVATLGVSEGLPYANLYALYQDHRGTVWIGTHGQGLWRLDGGRLTEVPHRPGFPRALLEDTHGMLWIGRQSGLTRVEADGLVPVEGDGVPRSRVNALLEDRRGRLWVGTETGLYQRGVAGAWREIDPARLPHSEVRALTETQAGVVVVGTGGGLALLADDGADRTIGKREGLPSDLARALFVDHRQRLWVGTEDAGIARIEHGQITTVSVDEGLFADGVHALLADGLGRLWMSSNQGIFYVTWDHLDAFADGRRSRVDSVAITERDGLRNREANGGTANVALRTTDGRLWFATQAGAVVIEPELAAHTPLSAPRVQIEEIEVAGDARRRLTDAVNLGPDQRNFSVHYTAPALRKPERLRFRYRLLNYDRDWVDAGSRHWASYTRVPPGTHRFRVEARIGDGAWGPADETRIVVDEHFHETPLFRGLTALALIGAVLLAVHVQGRRQRTQRLRLEALVVERTATIAEQAEQLKRLDERKSALFTDVSHEFRTPLTLTIGPLQDLMDGDAGALEPPAEEKVELALRNARRLLGLIEQLLDVARLDAGKLRLRVRRTDLATLTNARIEAFLPMARRRGIQIVAEPPRECVEAWVDPGQIQKIVDNLLANALRYTPNSGLVRLAVTPTGDARVRLSVIDTGPGIPADQLERVFERFYRVKRDGSRDSAGTGIGLALARSLALLHGGTLTVNSEEGRGATFDLTLRRGNDHFRSEVDIVDDGVDSRVAEPLWMVEPETRAPTGSDPEPPDDNRPIVLVVDDHAEIRGYVRDHLHPRYRVEEAEDGEEALAQARRRVPDLVISDVMMPGLDGYALLRALRADPELEFVPVVLLTAKAEPDARLLGVEEGASAYLTKPFEIRELTAMIHNLIDGRRRLFEHYAAAGVKPLALNAAAIEVTPADQDFVTRVGTLIESSLDQPDFGVEALANALGCDRSYLFRRLRVLLGETPSALIRRLRLERGELLLEGGAGSVAEVAYRVGFQSVSHFSQCFRERCGVTPSAYAKAAAAKRQLTERPS